MNATRKIEALSQLQGKVYVYFENEETCKLFLHNAEAEGYHFGKINPTDSSLTDIVAVETDKQLSHVGFVGRMAFQNPKNVKGEFYRIDYRKYVNAHNDYLITD